MDDLIDALKLGLKHIRVERRHIQQNLKHATDIELRTQLLNQEEQCLNAEMLILMDIENHKQGEKTE